MELKDKAKEILGLMRAKIFGITAGQSVYIGKHCSLKGKHHITLEDCVTVRPYTQIWSGGVQHLRCINSSLKRNLVCTRYEYLCI